MNSKALEAAREINSTCFAGTEFNAEAVNEWAAIISRVCKLEEAEKMRGLLVQFAAESECILTLDYDTRIEERPMPEHTGGCRYCKTHAAIAAFDAKAGQ